MELDINSILSKLLQSNKSQNIPCFYNNNVSFHLIEPQLGRSNKFDLKDRRSNHTHMFRYINVVNLSRINIYGVESLAGPVDYF